MNIKFSEKLIAEIGTPGDWTTRKWMVHYMTLEQTMSVEYGEMPYSELLKKIKRAKSRDSKINKIIVE